MQVFFSKRAEKDIKKVPKHVRMKLVSWIIQVETFGLPYVRKLPGYHDEPLRGTRQGQRSIRLSKQWRAFYRIENDIIIIEVNPHDY